MAAHVKHILAQNGFSDLVDPTMYAIRGLLYSGMDAVIVSNEHRISEENPCVARWSDAIISIKPDVVLDIGGRQLSSSLITQRTPLNMIHRSIIYTPVRVLSPVPPILFTSEVHLSDKLRIPYVMARSPDSINLGEIRLLDLRNHCMSRM